MLKKCISGGQTGADLAALVTAKKFGIPTGGWMPKGYRTLIGNKPEYKELYGIQEHVAFSYVPRTHQNAGDSDGTIRFAFDFSSAGEKCTLNGILKYNKPYIDVDLVNPRPLHEVVDWIVQNKIEILNVAGNSEKTAPGTYFETCEYLERLFEMLVDL